MNPYNPVGIPSPFDRLNNSIGSLSGDPELFPGLVDRLVMTAIDFRADRSIQAGKPTIGREIGGVSCVAFSFSRREIRMAMRQRLWFRRANVLNQRALEIDV